ncbi:Uncharacterised protein [Metamycoplasma cloacale]|uniref:Uncharacterized protein n=1 Tax=Metamycoplasma cloacale TaxID=92401 RepID=A0A2Z4LN22_9BACT|nr:hypothetical protein [Metamycoplasma cloacale]AWX42637.1 hypothetical protein DK849_00880 [Metamycoplasma cloacale]VEU79586.1 Uncharacterised protein [Metamycoplasma cloacale]
MKKTKKIIKLITTTALAGSSIGLIASSCTQGKLPEKPNKNETIQEENNLIKGNVKYIAIGDQWSADFYTPNTSTSGYLDQDSNVNGLSYSSYIANSIKLIEDSNIKLESFYNFSLEYTTIDDWLKLVNPESLSDYNNLANFEYNKRLEEKYPQTINNQNRLTFLFNNFENLNQTFFLSQLKEANLLTISLGFNDFFSKFELLDIVYNLINVSKLSNEEHSKKLQEIKDLAVKRAKLVNIKLSLLISEIRKINKDININLIGYTTPFLKLETISKNSLKEEFLTNLYSLLNETIEKTAEETKTNYFAFVEKSYLNRNLMKLNNSFFDAKPNHLAFKKLGQDIFMQMALKETDYNALVGNYGNKSNNYHQVFNFSVRPSTIKSKILGITSDNTLTFKMEYDFENLAQNESLLNELNNSSVRKHLLKTFKLYLNEAENISNQQFLEFIEKIFNIFNLSLKDLQLSDKLENYLTDANNRSFIVKLINKILDNNYLNKKFDGFLKAIDDLFIYKNINEIKMDEISATFKQNVVPSNISYEVVKEIFNSELIQNEEDKQRLIVVSTTLFNAFVVHGLLYKAIGLNNSEIFDVFLKDADILNKLNEIFEKNINNVINNYPRYFNTEQNNSFSLINTVLINLNEEISDLFKLVIEKSKVLTIVRDDNEYTIFELLTNKIIHSFKEIYQINETHFSSQEISDFEYFVKQFWSNLNNFEDLNVFIKFVIESYIDYNGKATSFNLNHLLNQFVRNLFNDKILKSDSNLNHSLLFKLISFTPNLDNVNSYVNGLKVIGKAFVLHNNILDSQNVSKVVDEAYRNNIINLVKNVINSDTTILNNQGKEFFKSQIEYVIQNIFQNNSLLNQIFKHLIEYIGINPIVNYLKDKKLDKKILENHHSDLTIEEYVKQWFDSIYESLLSDDLINEFKKIVINIIDNNSNYQFNEWHELVAKIYKNAKENNFVSLFNSLILNVVNNENLWNKGVELLFAYVKNETNTEFSVEEKTSLKNFIKNFILNVPNSTFFANLEKHIYTTGDKLVIDDITSFNDLAVFLKENLLPYFKLNNSNLVNNIIDLILVKNKENQWVVDQKELIRNLTYIFSKETLIDFIFKKVDLKTIISNALNSINLDAMEIDVESKGNLTSLLVDLNDFIVKQWDTVFEAKIKQLIKKIFNLDNVDNSESLQQFLIKGLKETKILVKEIIDTLFNDFLFDNNYPNRIELTSSLILTIIKNKLPSITLSQSQYEQLSNTLAKLIRKVYSLNVHQTFIDNLIDKITTNLEQYGFDFSKYNFQDLIDTKALLKSFNLDDILAFIKDDLNKEDIKNIIKIVLDNTKYILELLINKEGTIEKKSSTATEENNDNSTNTNSESVIFKIIKAILDKLTVEDKTEIINKSSESIKIILQNSEIKKLMQNLIVKELKNFNRDIVNEMINLDPMNRNISEYSTDLLELFTKEIINEENISLIQTALLHIVENEQLYSWNNTEKFVISILKNIDLNSLNTLVEKIIHNASHNEDLLNKLVNVFIAFIKVETKTILNKQEITKLSKYLKDVIKNLENQELFIQAKEILFNTLSLLTSSDTYGSSVNKIADALKTNVLQGSNFVNKLLDTLLASNTYNVSDVIQTAKVLMDKPSFVDWMLQKINFKEITLKYIDSIQIDRERFNKLTAEQLDVILKYMHSYFDKKYDTYLLPLFKELIANLFSDSVALKADSFADWISIFLKQNIQLIINKSNELFAEFVNDENNIFKHALATFLVELMNQDLKGVDFIGNSRNDLILLLEKLFTYIPKFKLFNGVIPTVINTIVDNLGKHQFAIDKYQWNNVINVFNVINGLNYEQIELFVKSLTSQEITSLLLLLLNNISKFSNIAYDATNDLENVNNISTSGSSPKEKSNTFVGFNGSIQININVYFNLLKSIFNILNDEDRHLIIQDLPKLSNWFINDEKMQKFVKLQLQVIKTELTKIHDSGLTFANELINSISHVIFEDEVSKKLVDSLLISLIQLNGRDFESIHNFNDLFTYIMNANKTNFKTFIRHLLGYFLDNQALVSSGLEFGLQAIITKWELNSTSDQVELIKSLLSRIIHKFGSLNIVESLIDDFLEQTTKLRILDESGHFDGTLLIHDLINNMKQIKYTKYLTTANIEDILATILNKDLSSKKIENELWALYTFIQTNIVKIKERIKSSNKSDSNIETSLRSDENSADGVVDNEFLEELEKLLYNLLSALNGSIKSDNISGKTALGNVLHRIVIDQMEKFDYSMIKNDVIDQPTLKYIITKMVSLNETKVLIDTLISDFLAGKKIIDANNLGQLISKIILLIKDNLKTNITNFVLRFAQDDEIINKIIDNLIKFLSLEGTTSEDRQFLADLIKSIIPELTKTELYQRKFLNRTIVQLANYAKEFDIHNPSKWFDDAIKKIISVFSFNDILVIFPLINDNKPIDGAKLVKLINLLFGKSNLQKSVLYDALRNLNYNPDPSQRTNMKYLNDQVSNAISNAFKPGTKGDTSDPDNISVEIDIFKTIDTLYRLMATELNKAIQRTPGANTTFKIRSKLPEWKAMYRFSNAINFAMFEMFGRETTEAQRDSNKFINLYSGVRSILWELQEGTNIKSIPGLSSKFAGVQYYLNANYRREMNNYVISESGWLIKSWKYFNEETYTPDAIMYIIATSGYNDAEKSKLRPFKFKVTEDGTFNQISKKEYVLLTLKEGGYGRFMKLNNIQSISSWSGLKGTTEYE